MKVRSTMIFDHIGVFVKELDYGYEQLSKLIDMAHKSEVYNDPLLRVSVQFCYDQGGLCYELVAPYGESSPVDPVLKNGSNILNHVAYKTTQFNASVSKLRETGCVPLGTPQPALAFNGARVIFFLTPLKLIFELIEDESGKV